MSFFRKIFIFFILFTALQNFNAYSEVVNKFEVKGNERISLETIMIFGDIAIGKNYEEKDISLLIKKLYETNFFSNISVDFADNKLTITVKENPIVQSLIFKGEKAQKFKDQLGEMLNVREKSSFVSNDITRDVNQIKTFSLYQM